MEREELIKIILGEQYEEGREIANKVLEYVSKNPCWQIEESMSNSSVVDALNDAVFEVFGHRLKYYDNSLHNRQYSEVRYMVMYLYRNYTRCTLKEVAGIFHKNHSTVVHGCNQVESLIRFNREFREVYSKLEESFKKFIV